MSHQPPLLCFELHLPCILRVCVDPDRAALRCYKDRTAVACCVYGRYVSDDDRVVLNVMDFSSPTSTGAHGKGLALVGSSSQASIATLLCYVVI